MNNEWQKLIEQIEKLSPARQRSVAKVVEKAISAEYSQTHSADSSTQMTEEASEKYTANKTIRLRVSGKVYQPFMWLLMHFKENEISVIEEDNNFQSVKAYLEKEFDSVERGTADFISIEQLEQDLETTIQRHEG